MCTTNINMARATQFIENNQNIDCTIIFFFTPDALKKSSIPEE